jgi:hypothetical protein
MILGTTNISVSLVANTLQENTTDVGKLCKSTNINMFAKYKPVSVNKIDGLTDTDFKNANYGLSVKRLSGTTMDNPQSWTYT